MNKRRVKPEHERREEIINAAYAVIYEVGLSNTTIAQIAKKHSFLRALGVIILAINKASFTVACVKCSMS